MSNWANFENYQYGEKKWNTVHRMILVKLLNPNYLYNCYQLILQKLFHKNFNDSFVNIQQIYYESSSQSPILLISQNKGVQMQIILDELNDKLNKTHSDYLLFSMGEQNA